MHQEHAEHLARIRRFAETLRRIAAEPESEITARLEAAIVDVLIAEGLAEAVAAELERESE